MIERYRAHSEAEIRRAMVTFRVHADLVTRIGAAARRERITRSEWIIRACHRMLEGGRDAAARSS